MELKGKTIGVVGLGMIGSEVARRCQALDMVTLGFDPTVSAETAAAAGITKVSLDALFAGSDFITLHTPLNDATRNLICAATLAKCKDGVYIINCARGGIVHEADLLAALNSGKVAGAAMDVFESEPPKESSRALIAHPKVRAREIDAPLSAARRPRDLPSPAPYPIPRCLPSHPHPPPPVRSCCARRTWARRRRRRRRRWRARLRSRCRTPSPSRTLSAS